MTFPTIKPNSENAGQMQGAEAPSPHTIFSINQLKPEEKRSIYQRVIPPSLLTRFGLSEDLIDPSGEDLLHLNCSNGSSVSEMALYHQAGFPDPLMYGQITDTINGQIHVLLYILNDPHSPRFDIDRTPDGEITRFGIHRRNLSAEIAAMEFGLAPGQIRRGLGIFSEAMEAFENFIESLGNELFFAEPLYYHNAVIFERYGFAYEKGRRLMERIQAGFEPGGDLRARLDGSTPFRSPQAADSIRLRSWALHDNLLDESFANVTMYKWVRKSAGLNTSGDCDW